MNLPNKLTVIRMVLTPIFLIVYMAPSVPYHLFIGLAVYVMGCITDFLDGKIARRYNLITTFGKLADPVADKMLTTAALLALMDAGYCSLYIVFIVLTREFAVTSVRLAASAQGVVIPANIWGKLKTVSQMVGIVLALFAYVLIEDFGINNAGFVNIANLVISILFWLSAVLCIISGMIYLGACKEYIDPSK